MSDLDTVWTLPFGYWLAVMLVAVLLIEAGLRWRQKWAVPTMMVYVTAIGWYIMEPVLSPDDILTFAPDDISEAFYAVAIFLVSCRLIVVPLSGLMAPRKTAEIDVDALPAERVFAFVAGLWLFLLAIGIALLNGDVATALFPDGRSGNSMWLRAAGADAGPFGFAISSAGYLYVLVLAAFGMLLPLLKRRHVQLLCLIVMLISWPYAFLQGSRNITLAVFVPLIFSFMFFSKARILLKGVLLIVAGVAIDVAMRTILTFRNVGFDTGADVKSESYLGLNMASELAHCINFVKVGILQETHGMGILAELGNVIPRAIWPGKPLIGIDYAIARGFGGSDKELGVVATISTGMIGQGVLEFGFLFGPIFIGFLMALWCAFLARLWAQGTVSRVCLFLFGMGLTFNLGRNVTMLVLWPMVFAFVAVYVLERYGVKRKKVSADFASTDLVLADPGRRGGASI